VKCARSCDTSITDINYTKGSSIKDVRTEGEGRGRLNADSCGQERRGVIDDADVRKKHYIG